ncbi:saccharopine dehydrogenase NADP-binding domain-containing protein [Streptomyces sp. NPDC050485]|uniref:saccharopine dehydrogenase NADP-binding domain-containing protein n=1 Tax=Streptomyces sp. NPDC050485 TaxID=3365617 RepID=UPI0037B95EC2
MIGVLGGYGDVGACASRELVRLGLGPLRVGGRDLAAGRRFVAGLGTPEAVAQAVDFTDEASLQRFADGCRILVNCAGPSHAVADRAARAALRAGAHYVDAAGDDALFAALDPDAWSERAAVLSAGLSPGLTGLLPRWAAARGFAEVHGMTCYFGLLDHFTEVAADDYLQGAADGVSEPLAAWRDGRRRPGALRRRTEDRVPCYPGAATLLPQLPTEGERLARALGITRGDWYTVVAGEHVRAAFDRVRALDRRDAVAALRRGSLLDLAGREPYVVLLAQLDGLSQGRQVTATAVLRGRRNCELTGAVTATATLAVDRGEVPAGRHFAAGALDPVSAMDRLRAGGAVTELSVLDAAIEELGAVEEGVL